MAKEHTDMLKIFSFAITVLVIVGGVIAGFATIVADQDNLKTEVKEVKTDQKETDKILDELRRQFAVQQTEVRTMGTDIAEQKTDIKAILRAVRPD
jgi:flagellar motility protein MotE (MotC chaperone)